MDIVLIILFFICLFVGGLSLLFMLPGLPIWAIVDVSSSKKLSEGARVAFIIFCSLSLLGAFIFIFGGGIALFLLGPLFALLGLLIIIIPLIYSCFVTDTKILRKVTVIMLTIILCSGLGTVVTGYISYRVIKKPNSVINRFITSMKEKQKADAELRKKERKEELEQYRGKERSLRKLSEADADNFDPFYAIYSTSLDKRSIARFTLGGPELDSAIPAKGPSIYPLNQIAVDPDGPRFYGITTHKFGEIDSVTGAFQEIEVDESLPELSWPAGLAFDTRRKRLIIASRGRLYAYYPETEYWEVVAEIDEMPLVYSSKEDLLYSLKTYTGKNYVDTLIKLNMRGAVVEEIKLSHAIMAGSGMSRRMQLICSSDKLIVLISKYYEDVGSTDNELISPPFYIIEPETGEVMRY